MNLKVRGVILPFGHVYQGENCGEGSQRTGVNISQHLLTFWAFWEHSSHPLQTHLELYIPYPEHLILGETDELSTTIVELHMHNRSHVTSKKLKYVCQKH